MTIQEVCKKLDEGFSSKVISYSEMRNFARAYRLRFNHGATRYCLYADNWDEVIKITRWEDVHHDYNQIEYENFLRACELGCDKVLLPIQKVATLKSGLDIYVQRKYTFSYSGLDDVQETAIKKKVRNIYRRFDKDFKSPEIFMKSCRNMYSTPIEYWYARAYQIYGKKVMKKLEILTNERSIGDLHSSNIGFYKNFPIILDFAGYFGD